MTITRRVSGEEARGPHSGRQCRAGFDIGTLAGMIATLERFADDEIPVPEGSSAAELRAFYAEWRSELMKLTEG